MTDKLDLVRAGIQKLEDELHESTAAFNDYRNDVEAKLAKLRAYEWQTAPKTAEQVVHAFVALRDERSALKKDYEERDEAVKERMNQHEVWLLDALNQIGGESIRTTYGTAFIQDKDRFNCSDWEEYWGYIHENKRYDLLEKRVAQGPIAAMKKDELPLPPGISVYSERVVTVRRS